MCALRTKEGYSSTSKEYSSGCQKNKKKKNAFGVQHKLVQKSVRLREVPGTGAFTSTGREATTSKGDVREKCARACVCVCVCVCVLLRCVIKIVRCT